MRGFTANKVREGFWPDTCVILFSMVAFSAGAFFNGFPIIHLDSHIYISAGFTHTYPAGRTIFYPLFVRFTGLNGLSLWTVIFAQNALLSWVALRVCKRFLGQKAHVLSAVILLACALLTGATWSQSRILADAFLPIMILALIEFMFSPFHWGLFALCVFAALTHLSYPLILTLTLVGALIIRFKKPACGARGLLALLFTVWMLLPVTNFLLFDSFSFGKGSQIFILGRLQEEGLLHKLLYEHCDEHAYMYCDYRQIFRPMGAPKFVWDNRRSPAYLAYIGTHGKGTHNDSYAYMYSQPEYSEMIRDIIRYYPAELLGNAIKSTLEQMGNMQFYGDLIKPNKLASLRVYFSENYPDFLKAKQEMRKLPAHTINRIKDITYWASLIALSLAIFRLRRMDMPPEWPVFQFICLWSLIVNAAECEALSTIDARYQLRIAWLLPFCTAITIAWIGQQLLNKRRMEPHSG